MNLPGSLSDNELTFFSMKQLLLLFGIVLKVVDFKKKRGTCKVWYVLLYKIYIIPDDIFLRIMAMITKFNAILFFYLLQSFYSSAQSIQWMKKDLPLIKTETDSSGNIYSSGSTLIKLNGNGDTIWHGQEYSWEIALDECKNIYSTGSFSGVIVFGSGNNSHTLTSQGASDVLITKRDSLGNIIWAIRGGGGNYDGARTIRVHKGSIYIIGTFGINTYFSGPNNSDTLIAEEQIEHATDYIAKFDTSGNFIWAKKIALTDNYYLYDVCADRLGNVMFTGQYYSEIKIARILDTLTLLSNGMITGKLDSDGNVLWIKNGTGADGRVVKVDEESNSYVLGNFHGTCIFDNFAISGGGFENSYIVKYDTAGFLVWIKKITGLMARPYDIVIRDTVIYVVGQYKNTCTFEGGTILIQPNSYGTYGYLGKYSINGYFIWGTSIIVSGDINPRNICSDNFNNIYISGTFCGTIYGDNDTLIGNQDGINWRSFLIKVFDNNTIDSGTSTIVTANFTANKIQLCSGDSVNFSDSSIGDVTNWNWVFEGGSPETSTLQNPKVIYQQAGTYYTKQVVSNSTASDSVLTSNYITVSAAPVVSLGNDTILLAGTTLVLDAENSGSQYVWNNGNTSQTIAASMDGVYSVIVTDQKGCTGTDEINIATTVMTSSEPIDNSILLIAYPNPANGIFTIRYQSKSYSELIFTVSDSNGKLIYRDNRKNFSGPYAKTIDLSTQSKGTYFIEMIADGKRELKKIVLD